MSSHMLSASLKRDLSKQWGEAICFDVPLAEISRWKIGGTADVVIAPRNSEELAKLRAWLYENNLCSIVIGATSNLLFSDEGLRAIAIQIGPRFSELLIEDRRVIAQSGVWVPGVARKAMQAGLSGLEHTCGIPGTLGGLVYMNGGSQRKGISSNITYIKSINEQGKTIVRAAHECEFSYRSSIFQKLNEVIVEVCMELSRAEDKRSVRSDMLSIMRSRRNKFPRKLPNCGSVFKSNPAMYEVFGTPGSVIENFGLKGVSIGGATISPHHANFIVNAGGATASDVLALIEKINFVVSEETGYNMDVEVLYVSSLGEIMPADKAFPYIKNREIQPKKSS